MRTSDVHRGLTTALAAGVAGLMLWVATEVGQGSTQRFWVAMGIVAGAGLVMAASQLLGGWTKWGWPRVSMGVFTLAFLPVLVCVGWILLATQPGNGWHEGLLVDWSHSLGIYGLVHAFGLYHGVLAFAFGLVFGFSFDTTGSRRRNEAIVEEARLHEPANVPVARDDRVADEPVTAEREEIAHTDDPVPLGHRDAVGTGGETQQARGVEIREDGRRVVPAPPIAYPTELD
jgi:hypothetical protein